MNQQRSRRFKSALEAREAREASAAAREKLAAIGAVSRQPTLL